MRLSKGSLSAIGEFGLIENLKKFQRSSPDLVQGIGDDAAVFRLDAGRYQLLTTDMLVEDVHFTRRASPGEIGHKAMAVNVSDIAAMGGLPTFAVVSIGIPSPVKAEAVRGFQGRKAASRGQSSSMIDAEYIQQIYRGMADCAKAFGAALVGGDTVKAEQLIINIALLGVVERSRLILRSGARPGDRIFVTGPLGGSLASGRHLRFTPRVRESRFIVENYRPSAMIDISDGLVGDLGHILRQSGVGAVLDEDRIPLNPGVSLGSALSDGEDFELLFTLSSLKAKKLLEYRKHGSNNVFIEIGEIVAGSNKLSLRDASGRCRAITAKGFEHF